MSNFESKKAEAIRLLQATGIRPSNYLPPATKALWHFGIEAPPPHFVSFSKMAIYLGGYFAFIWGAIMYFFGFAGISVGVASLAVLATSSAMAGILFGLSMATYYAYGRRKHRLPSWETLGQNEGAA